MFYIHFNSYVLRRNGLAAARRSNEGSQRGTLARQDKARFKELTGAARRTRANRAQFFRRLERLRGEVGGPADIVDVSRRAAARSTRVLSSRQNACPGNQDAP